MPKNPKRKPSDLLATSGPTMEERIRNIHADMAEKIQKYGWSTLMIFGTKEGELPFSYTLGAKTVGLPDLIISGLFRGGAAILNSIMSEARNGLELKEGVAYPQFANMPLMLKRLKPSQVKDRMYQTFDLYGSDDFEVFQVVYPDPNGIFPEAEGYDFPRQELFWKR